MKFITSEGKLEDGSPLSDEEIEILQCVEFSQTELNKACKAYLSARDCVAIFTHIIRYFELRRRVALDEETNPAADGVLEENA